MSTYTVAQLKQAASNAGFTGNALVIAVAISLAENGSRNPAAVSPTNSDGSRDHGAWQINDKAHAALIRSGNVNDLNDNARMAYKVYTDAGKSFRPWTTFNHGTYKAHLSDAQKGTTPGNGFNPVALLGVGGLIAAANGVGPGQIAGGATSALSNAGDLAGHLLDSAFWKRIGIGALAALMLILGIVIMVESNGTVRGVTKTAAKAAALA